jgi:hypothetical protein
MYDTEFEFRVALIKRLDRIIELLEEEQHDIGVYWNEIRTYTTTNTSPPSTIPTVYSLWERSRVPSWRLHRGGCRSA